MQDTNRDSRCVRKCRSVPALFVALSLALAAGSSHGQVSGSQLPDFGDSSGSLISPAQEREFGAMFMRSIRAQTTLINDPHTVGYIRQLGDRLVTYSDSPGYPFTFFVVQDPSVNAFAGPGGYIGIHTGLILTAENESELAGVMAHEIAHVTQRHLLRAYESASQMSLPTAAAMIAAVLLGAATDPGAGMAAASAVQAGNIQHQLNFTRANEKEADRIGIQTLGRSGIDPFGMPAFFERLYQSTRLYGNHVPEFLLTHPVTSDRIAESVQRAEELGRGKERNTLEFDLIKVRLDVMLSDSPRASVEKYQKLAKQQPHNVAIKYALALASTLSGDTASGKERLSQLMTDDPDRIIYRTTLANLEMESGQTRTALNLFRDTLSLYPGDLATGQYYTAALIQAGQADQARKQILTMLKKSEARTMTNYELWAKASSISGPQWETRQATAEVYYLAGNLQLAIDQLEQAMKMDGMSEYEKARIQARLEEFKHELVEREKD
jgi:predicted Zn-dependent protease